MPPSTTAIDPFAPAPLGPITLRNRFIKAATFEGMAKKNLVTDRLIEFHRVMAAGGLGMTTVAYLAVSEDGQGAPNEIGVRRSRPSSATPARWPRAPAARAYRRRSSGARWR